MRMERDDNGDGRIDLKVFYKDELQTKALRDTDGDGRFETVQHFRRAPWDVFVETDKDGDGKAEDTFGYKNGQLRFKSLDETGDGIPDMEETYNAQGRLVRSREAENEDGRFSLTWFYNEEEEAIRGEKDGDGDGRVDTWFHYENGQVKSVEEDRNRDGKPDLWEYYDSSEALVRRSEDLDFDGTADVVRTE